MYKFFELKQFVHSKDCFPITAINHWLHFSPCTSPGCLHSVVWASPSPTRKPRFPHWSPPGFVLCICAKPAQSCPTLCDPVDCSPAGSSVHGILQATVLECVAISSPRGSSRPRDRSCTSCVSCAGRRILHR